MLWIGVLCNFPDQISDFSWPPSPVNNERSPVNLVSLQGGLQLYKAGEWGPTDTVQPKITGYGYPLGRAGYLIFILV